MKIKLIISVIAILVAIVFSCKKTPEIPTGNKIEIDETNEDTTGYTKSCITSSVTTIAGNTISQHGHCWSTSNKPTIEDNHTSLGELNSPKSFTSTMDSLLSNTRYFVRPYLQYSHGLMYGDSISITTLKTGKPTIITSPVTEITFTTASCGGEVTADSGLVVINRGVCWDTVSGVSLEQNIGITTDGDSLGVFTSNITGLNEGVTYYLVAYSINEKGVSYGERLQFSTVAITIPIVTTTIPTDILATIATCGGNVTGDGNSTVTARGICWNTNANPTLDNNIGFTSNGNGTGSFTSYASELSENTTYYVTAYATNNIGTAYGDVKQFTTYSITLPTVTTNTPTNITNNSATCGGIIINDGYSDIESKGVCWNTEGNPTLLNNVGFTNDGNNSSSFISNILGLTNNTIYFVTAYATNELGTAYGEIHEFLVEDPPCGDLTINYGGQIYHTVKIGYQCWMKENLNIGTKVVNSEEMQDNGVIEKFCYNNDEANCDIYGGLYNWDEMMQYTTTNNERGICPIGWHIPSDEEWKVLEGNSDTQYGVGSSIWDQEEYRGYDVGKRLKTTTGWISNTGSNAFDFSVLPGGFRKTDGYYRSINELSYIWTSTKHYWSGWVWNRFFDANNNKVYRSRLSLGYGFSVRCIQN